MIGSKRLANNTDMSDSHTTDPDDHGYTGPSKSQVKRDMHALVDLGKELLNLSNDKLSQLQLGEKLNDAIKETKRITAREARRRHIHYIGKLLRHEDADAIRHQLDVWTNGSKEQAKAMHRLEALRDVLLRSDAALTEFFDTYQTVNVQEFRGLVRAARREAQQNEALAEGVAPSRKHYRNLFQAIKNVAS
ncbi:MAG TPA: DUF615 domain-containing protein [Candidatus Paenalcaligenes intestinipullorum]|uniref:Dual-action ribosomal maturation protein DarP n=1 Tax=Candidatus Paenalcaligenes intestinipullorum TaxID=2838718 RepID=A0A9D2U999_9BURK|nr:DUF615 domain-containing protein [Candidatus Paenalcaligenes intestinipullorum]